MPRQIFKPSYGPVAWQQGRSKEEKRTSFSIASIPTAYWNFMRTRAPPWVQKTFEDGIRLMFWLFFTRGDYLRSRELCQTPLSGDDHSASL